MTAVLDESRNRRSLSAGPVDLDDRVVADVWCIECGANLRGQNVREPCSGCGHPNSDSVFGDFLIYASPVELRKLDEAATVVIVVAAFTGILGAVVIAGMLLASRSVMDAIDRAFDGLLFTAMLLPVVTIFGIMLLTRRHAVAYFVARYGNPRFLTTIGIGSVLAAVVCAVLAHRFGAVFAAVVCTAWAVGPTAAFMFGMRGLMRRIPNQKLANFANWMVIPLVALGGLGLFVHLARPMIASPSEWDGPLLAMRVIVVLGGISWSVGVYRLLRLARGSIRIAGR